MTTATEPTCINLKERFGDRFKVEYEESYFAERSKRTVEDPWLMILLCQHGHVYPHGGEILVASTDRRGSIAKRLAKLDCVTVLQDAADGINAAFHVSSFDRVAEIMRPRKARRLSPEQRARLAEAGRNFRFSAGAQAPENGPESHVGVLHDKGVTQGEEAPELSFPPAPSWQPGSRKMTCVVCREPFASKRLDADCCSPRCRKRRERARCHT